MLDGRFLIHTPFASGVWPAQGKAEKVMNLYLGRGKHTLTFSHLWPPGLPYLEKFFLKLAEDVSGKVRLIPLKDSLAFRKDEPFWVRIMAERRPEPYSLVIQIVDAQKNDIAHSFEQKIRPGESVFEQTVAIPTDLEGIFDLKAFDKDGRAVDRALQYIVVNTVSNPPSTQTLQKDLVMKISAVKQTPDYTSGEDRVVEASFGSYRESGKNGYFQKRFFDRHPEQTDYFAYSLNLPAIQEPYLVEVDYPDDAERTFTISLVEKDVNPYSLDSGIKTGGSYAPTGQTQTHQMFFYPRQTDPRLLFLNWHTGQRAAVKEIRIYRVDSGFPALAQPTSGRRFGIYFEEPLRFTTYFGALPVGNTWETILSSAERWAHWSRFIGANFWQQTIAAYQSMMWPAETIPGYGMADEDGIGVIGPFTSREPLRKDLLRLMLLVCEKYGLDFIGEIHIPGNEILLRALDRRFGGDGNLSDNVANKPWLLASKDGVLGVRDPQLPYFNPIHPAVQDWVLSVVKEIAERYKDSQAFKGVAIRLIGWSFSSWQSFPSIHWGYDDYTVALFEKEKGIHIPVPSGATDRFASRYRWLMDHAYEDWVSWRASKIRQYYKKIARVLIDARSDLRLYVHVFGPNYSPKEFDFGRSEARTAIWDEKGWLKMIREAGIDPALYKQDQEIMFGDSFAYPEGIYAWGPRDVLAAFQRDIAYDVQPIEEFAKTLNSGRVASVNFFNEYAEADFFPERIGVKKTSQYQCNNNRICAAINPAGHHVLARYANAIANGNVTMMSDGGLGYVLGQPDYLREFLAEYRSLPDIGMSPYPNSGDPVALWSGVDQGHRYFYLVNRADYPIGVGLRFGGGTVLKLLSSGKSLAVAGDGRLNLTLRPYQLVALGNATDDGGPIAFEIRVPDEIKKQLQAQLDFVKDLLRSRRSSMRAGMELSDTDWQQARRALEKARQDYVGGRYWSVRQTLMGHRLVKVFHALETFPPNLFYRNAPHVSSNVKNVGNFVNPQTQ
jgi:hypothetical protein